LELSEADKALKAKAELPHMKAQSKILLGDVKD